jgi:hypothetical protein
MASSQAPPGVSARGRQSSGERGNVGEPSISWRLSRRGGPGDHRPWRAGAAFTRPRAPRGHHERHGSRQGIGQRAPSNATRDGQGGSLRGAASLGRWGTQAPRTHGREGEAGPHERLDRPTGATWRSPTVPPNLPRMAAQAAQDPARVFTTRAPLLDAAVLREAYRQTSQASAAGIDGVTAHAYAAPLAAPLRALHGRLRRGRSQAPPGACVWRDKAEGGQRPIGQPTCEDKRVQRAVAMRWEAIDAQDFDDGSSGCRPGRSPHDARHALRERCMNEGLGGSVDAEGSGYGDRMDKTR